MDLSKLHKYLVSLGFSRSKNEQAVYLKWSDKSHLIIRVYVDDLLVIGEKDSEINDDLRQLCSYLDIEMAQGGARITLSQRAYALNILDLARMRECNLVHGPLEARHPTSEHLPAIKHILRYVKGTIDYGLVNEKGQTKVNLVDYSDSDFAGDVDDRESTSRQAFFLGEMLICWASQK
ncbi:unnamed protein product [Spirodela intermedia]|uniref:Reverse transcriptase Ty1/copia-type domain-containing protein n=1 Tax=Spirodela intermedia TaxID=51605 RepID=A0A7I8L941_SPIIN|nr:unnamed protein product [Spirodela intermedia]